MRNLSYITCGVIALGLYLLLCIHQTPKSIRFRWDIYFSVLSLISLIGWWLVRDCNVKNILLTILFIPVIASMTGYGVIMIGEIMDGRKYHLSIYEYWQGWLMCYFFSETWMLSVVLIVAVFLMIGLGYFDTKQTGDPVG